MANEIKDGGAVVGSEVFTEDGNRAIYAGEIDGQKFVRLIIESRDAEYGPDEWPSDRLTPVGRIFLEEPIPAIGKMAAEIENRVAKAREEEAALRRSVLDLRQQEKELTAAIANFPEVATAMDFLSGKITHVVVDHYSGIQVQTLDEALAYCDDVGWGGRTQNGLKLLCLFGHAKGKPARWAINAYHDGSGMYTTVTPFRSEAEARAEVQRLADVAFERWRRDGKENHIGRFLKSGATIPQDYLDSRASKNAKNIDDRIAKLRAEISVLLAAREGGEG